jgi:hypothetical protein
MVHDSGTNTLIFSAGAVRPVIGNAHADEYNNTWSYDLSQGTAGVWVAKDAIPHSSNHISYATTRDANGLERHYFFGGQIGENEYAGNVKTVYEYVHGPSPNWIRRQDMLLTRGHASSSSRPYGCGIIVIGGMCCIGCVNSK